MPNEKILIVDDDPAIVALCRRILETEGFRVTQASRGEEALNQVDADHFDLVLTDIRLPGLTGLDMAARLRSRGHDLTLVTMTGYSSMEMAIQALSLGVDEFIVKPFTPDSLRMTIARALEKSRLRRENTRLRALLPLFESTRAFVGAGTREELNQRVVRAATKTIGAQDVALVQIDHANHSLFVVASFGAEFAASVGRILPLAVDTVAEFSSLDKVQVWRGDEISRRLPLVFSPGRAYAALCAPLIAHEQTIGFLLALTPEKPEPFSASDTEAFAIVAGQAAAALENAQLIDEISRSYRDLQELDRLKSEFINIAAHELRTPLSVLMGYAMLMVDELLGDEREQMQYIVNNAERLRHVVDDMLSLRYLETGQAELRLESFEVAEALHAVVEAYRGLAEDKSQPLKVELADDLGRIVADRAMVDLMLGNLLSNAIKFSPRTSPIRFRAWGGENEITIALQDEGRGVAPSEHDRIFGRFYQVENSLTREHGGLGLGLAITRGMVQAHRGKVWVESESGQGSTFYITLPRVAEPRVAPLRLSNQSMETDTAAHPRALHR